MRFEEFARAHGLLVGSPRADGRWRRCPTQDHPKKDNGSYLLRPDRSVGFVQNWESMSQVAVWRPDDDGFQPVPAIDKRALTKERAERRRMEQEASEGARSFFARCRPLRKGHRYLRDHGLDMRGCEGIRVDGEGWLVIPAWRKKIIRSVQRISRDGEKRYWPGAPIRGTYYPIRKAKGSRTMTVLCEGVATGLAVFACLPDAQVIVAWDTTNLQRMNGFTGMVVVAADNDHVTEARIGKNPGIEAAKKVAEENGYGMAYPEYIRGSDFADYRIEVAAQRFKPRFGGENKVRREVDAEVGRLLTEAARFVTPKVRLT